MKRFFILSLFFAFATNFNAQTKLPPLGIDNPFVPRKGEKNSKFVRGPRTKTYKGEGRVFDNEDATRFLQKAVNENNVTNAEKFLKAGASAFISYEMIDKKQYEMIDVMHKDNPKLIRYSQLLHHACAKSDAEMIDFLIERGASLDLCGYHVEWDTRWAINTLYGEYGPRKNDGPYILTSKLWNGDGNYRDTPADVALIYMRLDNLKHIKDKYHKYPSIYGLNRSLLNSIHKEKMIRLILSNEFQNDYIKPAGYNMADVINFGYHYVNFEHGGSAAQRVISVYLINMIIQKIGEYRNSNNKEMEKEYMNFLNQILAEGVDVNKNVPLYVAMRHKNMMDIVKLLRSKGAKMTAIRNGKTVSLLELDIYDEYKEYFMLEGE